MLVNSRMQTDCFCQKGGYGERGSWMAAAAQRLRAVLSDWCSLGRRDFQAGYIVISKN